MDGTVSWYTTKGGDRRCLFRVNTPDGQVGAVGKTEAEAKKKARAKAYGPKPEAATGGTQTLDTFYNKWLTEGAQGWYGSTLKYRRDNYDKHIKTALGHRMLKDLTPEVLQSWANGLPTDKYKYRLKILLSMCLNEAVSRKVLKENPLQWVRVPSYRVKEQRAWTFDQLDAFWEVARDSYYKAYWALGVTYTLRPEEILGLEWKTVDLNAGTAKIVQVRATLDHETFVGPPKTDMSGRTFDIHGPSLEVLRRWKAEQNEQKLAMGAKWPGGDYVVTGRAGRPPDEPDVYDAFRRRARWAKLPPISLYELRHTLTTIHAREGVPIEVLSKMLGHANVKVTQQVYRVVLADEKRAATMALGARLGRGASGPKSANL